MFNKGFWIRVLIAVVVLVAVFTIVPPIFRVIGFPLSADWDLIIKVVVGVLALFYVFLGTYPVIP